MGHYYIEYTETSLYSCIVEADSAQLAEEMFKVGRDNGTIDVTSFLDITDVDIQVTDTATMDYEYVFTKADIGCSTLTVVDLNGEVHFHVIENMADIPFFLEEHGDDVRSITVEDQVYRPTAQHFRPRPDYLVDSSFFCEVYCGRPFGSVDTVLAFYTDDKAYLFYRVED